MLPRVCIPTLAAVLLFPLLSLGTPDSTTTGTKAATLPPGLSLPDQIPTTRMDAPFAYRVLDRFASDSATTTATPPARVHGVFIGVGEYALADTGRNRRDTARPNFPSLRSAVRDAESLSEAMKTTLGVESPRVLLNEKATLAQLDATFRELAPSVGPDDLFILSFSGHSIGIEHTTTGLVHGFLLLHSAPPLNELRSRGTRRDMIDAVGIRQMMQGAGLQPRETLFLFDCGYEEMAIRPSVPEGTHGLPGAFTILSTGGNATEVFSPSETREHGHLTAAMLDLLTKADSPLRQQVGAASVQAGEIPLLPMSRLHDFVAPGFGEAKLDELEARTNALLEKAVPSPPSIATDAAAVAALVPRVPPAFREDVRRFLALREAVEPPRYVDYGPGTVLLPLAPVPHAERPSASTSATPAWRQFARAVGQASARPDYGDALERVLELVHTVEPSVAPNPNVLRVGIEVLSRPLITEEAWERIQPSAGFNPIRVAVKDRPRWRNQWRDRAGANWMPVDLSRPRLSPSHELQLRVSNQGTNPIAVYAILLDSHGLIQWWIPRNDTWDKGPFPKDPVSQGAKELGPKIQLVLPAHNDNAWPIRSADRDLALYVVATKGRWPELEAALQSAASKSFELRDALTPPETDEFAFEGWPTLFRSTLQLQPGFIEGPEPTQTRVRRQFTTPGQYVMVGWMIDVVGSDVVTPVLEPD